VSKRLSSNKTEQSKKSVPPPKKSSAKRQQPTAAASESDSEEDEESASPQKKKKKRESEIPWGLHHPIMKKEGKVLFNKNLLKASTLSDTLKSFAPPGLKLTKAEKETLLKNVNSYMSTTFNKLCDNAPSSHGVWSYQQASIVQIKTTFWH
jgi:hypothetical protein